jgi:hypothetical protein
MRGVSVLIILWRPEQTALSQTPTHIVRDTSEFGLARRADRV